MAKKVRIEPTLAQKRPLVDLLAAEQRFVKEGAGGHLTADIALPPSRCAWPTGGSASTPWIPTWNVVSACG